MFPLHLWVFFISDLINCAVNVEWRDLSSCLCFDFVTGKLNGANALFYHCGETHRLKSNGKCDKTRIFIAFFVCFFRAGCCPVGWMTPKSRTTTRSAWKKSLTVSTPAAAALCAQRNSLTSASRCTWMMPHQLSSIRCCRTRTASLPGCVYGLCVVLCFWHILFLFWCTRELWPFGFPVCRVLCVLWFWQMPGSHSSFQVFVSLGFLALC